MSLEVIFFWDFFFCKSTAHAWWVFSLSGDEILGWIFKIGKYLKLLNNKYLYNKFRATNLEAREGPAGLIIYRPFAQREWESKKKSRWWVLNSRCRSECAAFAYADAVQKLCLCYNNYIKSRLASWARLVYCIEKWRARIENPQWVTRFWFVCKESSASFHGV